MTITVFPLLLKLSLHAMATVVNYASLQPLIEPIVASMLLLVLASGQNIWNCCQEGNGHTSQSTTIHRPSSDGTLIIYHQCTLESLLKYTPLFPGFL